MSKSKDCVVHYEHLKVSSISQLSLTVHSALIESKNIRQTLGEEHFNNHKAQCDSLPKDYIEGIYWVHKECYRNFVQVKSSRKWKTYNIENQNKANDVEPRVKRKKITHGGTRELFPNVCFFCKEYKLQVYKRTAPIVQYPSKVVTDTANETIKVAAELYGDDEMLAAITGVDLVAKEFQKHDYCYKNYTVVVHRSDSSTSCTYSEKKNSDFDSVVDVVEQEVLTEHRCVPIDYLVQVYGFDRKDRNARRFLKSKLKEKYDDRLLFLTVEQNKPMIVISQMCLTSRPVTKNLDEASILKQAAKILRQEAQDFFEKLPDISHPPTVEELSQNSRKPPEIILNFYLDILSPHHSHHVASDRAVRLSKSFSEDLLSAISENRYISLKHAATALGLHSLTGQKMPIQCLHRMGHSISYDMVRRITTAQAELAQCWIESSQALPIQPKHSNSVAPVVFWWDNFDRKIESTSGKSSIHNTPGVAFQEVTSETVERDVQISVRKSGRRSLQSSNYHVPANPKINPKRNPSYGPDPPPTSTSTPDLTNSSHFLILSLWTQLRRIEDSAQIYPRFIGWISQLFNKPDSKATVLTYLPPIERPITDYGTIIEMFIRSEKLSKQANMKYVHITLDVGAAIKAHHVLWNQPERWSKVIIHLGDFHALMDFFGCIGNYVSGSGFEETLYQSGLCQPGVLSTVLLGKHYNRCWTLHEAFAEAIERLFQEKYFPTPIPEEMQGDSITNYEQFDNITSKDSVREFLKYYQSVRNDALSGQYGKTVQYWLQYSKLIGLQQMLHYAINVNDFEWRLQCWKMLLPYCFVYNKIHYARYGTFYVNMLDNLDTTHPGAKEELKLVGVSVRRNNLGIGQAIDMAGEQTFMRSGKTAGGITNFASRPETVRRWVLNRPFQARFAEALLELTGLEKSSTNPKKCLRGSEILKSNELVHKVMHVLSTNFLNPFHENLDKDKLYNLVSGSPVQDDIVESLLSVSQTGQTLMQAFQSRVQGAGAPNGLSFFDPIKKNKYLTFNNSAVKAKVKVGGKSQEVLLHRDILGQIAALSSKNKAGVDMDKIIEYPLAPVSLPLCSADGTRRTTTKSKLFDAALNDMEICGEQLPDSSLMYRYYLDLAASVRTFINQCVTIRDLCNTIINSIPHQFTEIFIICDTYQASSIKNSERKSRGEGEKYVLVSPEMKIPYDIVKFLSVGENKERLFELILQCIVEDKERLGNRVIYFSGKELCTRVSNEVTSLVDRLQSDHEEADSKLVAFVANSDVQQMETVMIRSPSGDIDIICLFLAQNFPFKVLIDNGTGSSRRIIDINSTKLTPISRKAVLGLHSFTGNDYVSSFFRKGKKVCWTKMLKEDRFINLFSNLGDRISLDEDTFKEIELYVCTLYGYPRLSLVNEVRKKIFWKYYDDKNRIVELCFLPPCQMNLRYHSQRSNYVAYMSKHANHIMQSLECPSLHGWNENMTMVWETECIPGNISQLLFPNDSEPNETNYEEDEEDQDSNFDDESDVEDEEENECDDE